MTCGPSMPSFSGMQVFHDNGTTEMKRSIDLVAALVLLIILAPVFLILAICVRVDVGSPILFRQARPGLHGEAFTLIKFRTMRHARPDEIGPDADSQRLTRLGRWLRATSLDELPELWNVLCGDMSLVGPRPLLMQYLPRYTAKQMRRHEVRPGLTGWAQVSGRNSLSWDEKFKLDLWYVDHRSLCLDLKILLLTIATVFKRQGISYEDAATMPEFLGSHQSSNGKTGSR
jgi:sugar transferase EpsL